MTTQPRVFGVLVTFGRPLELEQSLLAIRQQTLPLEQLVVVDNEGGAAEAIVREHAPSATYVRAGENLGPAGGIAVGMRRVVEVAADGDWVFTLDDDDWTSETELFARLLAFGEEMRALDVMTAGVGRSGTRFDHRTGRIVRVGDHELHGPVPVDCIAGNQFPLYSVHAVREAGFFRSDLFFGFEELEFGLRLRRAGYQLYVQGEAWHQHRERLGLLAVRKQPSRALAPGPSWKRYYSIRNLIYILRSSGRSAAAVRVTATSAVGKPLANLPLTPRRAVRYLKLGLRASWDGWHGRLGRTIEPRAPKHH